MSTSRIHALRAQLSAHGVDAMLIAHPPHVHYATTRFSGSNGLCVLTKKGAHFLSDFRYKEQSAEQVDRGWKIHIPVGGALLDTVAKEKLLGTIRRVGFEAEYVSVAQLAVFRKKLRGVTLVPVDGFVETCALKKEPWEIACIKRAAAISAKAFHKTLEMIKPGVRERDVAAELTYLQRTMGAEGDAFDAIIASGTRGAFVHGRASERKIRNHELVTIDFGSVVEGYHCDITRTIAVGTVNAEQRRIYQLVYDAQERALDTVRAGVDAKVLDASARDFLAAHGFREEFGHSLGHGLGLEVHERPRISQGAAGIAIPENAAITIEPGVYLPKKFGVRIEDDVRVTRTGYELLTSQITRRLITL